MTKKELLRKKIKALIQDEGEYYMDYIMEMVDEYIKGGKK